MQNNRSRKMHYGKRQKSNVIHLYWCTYQELHPSGALPQGKQDNSHTVPRPKNMPNAPLMMKKSNGCYGSLSYPYGTSLKPSFLHCRLALAPILNTCFNYIMSYSHVRKLHTYRQGAAFVMMNKSAQGKTTRRLS